MTSAKSIWKLLMFYIKCIFVYFLFYSILNLNILVLVYILLILQHLPTAPVLGIPIIVHSIIDTTIFMEFAATKQPHVETSLFTSKTLISTIDPQGITIVTAKTTTRKYSPHRPWQPSASPFYMAVIFVRSMLAFRSTNLWLLCIF